MIGSIAGDIIGSIYEYVGSKQPDVPLFAPKSFFTDDTVLTVAVADCLLNHRDYTRTFQEYARRHPDRGYGEYFSSWAIDPDPKPYNSYGNGSAMRASPIGYFFNDLKEVLKAARESAEVTHNHPEGIKGAQTTAAVVFLGRTGAAKKEIREYVAKTFGYDLSRSLGQICKNYTYDVTCQGTVPEAITVFLESSDYEDAIRKALSLGGDADTLACITGGMAQAFYGKIAPYIVSEARKRLTPDLLEVLNRFEERCPAARPRW